MGFNYHDRREIPCAGEDQRCYMKTPIYENKLERPRRVVKVRGTTVSLIWDGYDWIIDKLTASERKAGAISRREKEGE